MVKYIRENNENIIEIPLECIKGATLLSKEEYEKYKDSIPEKNRYWWLRTAGNDYDYACSISRDCSVDDCCSVDYADGGIRPTLILNIQSSNVNFCVGDKFNFGKHLFTIISNNLAICDDFVGESCFRKDWEAPDANVYEKSDVKKVIDEWFKEAYLNKKLGVKSDKEIFNYDDWGF